MEIDEETAARIAEAVVQCMDYDIWKDVYLHKEVPDLEDELIAAVIEAAK